ncbi:hypothetical protein GLYMA_15G219050v4 [Glycine max]|nr:hypothetical protein GLYMA_15G219050v4 [Glycine max]
MLILLCVFICQHSQKVNMLVRQIWEGLEQQLVNKPHLQNPINGAKKVPRAVGNGKGPPPPLPQQELPQNQTSPQARNNRRRRSRGEGRKFDQGDILMRPIVTRGVENGSIMCGEKDMSYPTSSKSLSFASRPGYGQVGRKCIVKSNHFFA